MASNTPNRKLGPRIEGCHEISETFNGYGNLTSAQILYGKDQQDNFLVPSHHIFGGIFIKVKEDYDHNAITDAVNAKRSAEGLDHIDKRSCTRRLAAAIIGRERVAADQEEREIDLLKAQVDYDTAHGKDPAIAKAARTQKQHARSANAQYGNRTTPAKAPKRSLSQITAQDEDDSVENQEPRPKKAARKQKRKTIHDGNATDQAPDYFSAADRFGQQAHGLEGESTQTQYPTYQQDPGMLGPENGMLGYPTFLGGAHGNMYDTLPTFWEDAPQAAPAFHQTVPSMNEDAEDQVAKMVQYSVLGAEHVKLSDEDLAAIYHPGSPIPGFDWIAEGGDL